MDPETEKLQRALDKSLRKRESAATYLESTSAALRLLVSLDHGMIDGAVVPADRRVALITEAGAFASTQLGNAARLDRARAARWLSSVPVYERPKSIDFAAWERLVASAKDTRPTGAPLDLTSPEVPTPLAETLRALLALGQVDPDRHRFEAAASDTMIKEREEELGVEIPFELALLYRLSNGFSLFRRDGSLDVDASPFRLVPLHELQPFAFTVGDELPRRRSRRAKKPEVAMNDPARLQVFDVGNGDFVSCCSTGDQSVVWVDDYSDGPQRPLTSSMAELLDYVMSPERLDPEAGWTHSAWEGLGR